VPGFFKRHRFALLVLLLMAAALYRIASSSGGVAPAGPVRSFVLEVSAALQEVLTTGVRVAKNAWNRYLFLVGLQDENARLRRVIADLHQQVTDLREEAAAGRRLKELLDLKKTFGGVLVPAVVVGHDISGWSQTIVVDRGRNDGVVEGMAVICPMGLVGQVMKSSADFSRVLLVTDHSSEIAALTQRTRARGIVEGMGDRFCRIKYLHVSEDVREGDAILSSGMDRTYPKGIFIGTVTRVNKKKFGLFQEAEIEPGVDFSRLEEVLIVVTKAEALP